jgi:hypothetical protein
MMNAKQYQGLQIEGSIASEAGTAGLTAARSGAPDREFLPVKYSSPPAKFTGPWDRLNRIWKINPQKSAISGVIRPKSQGLEVWHGG